MKGLLIFLLLFLSLDLNDIARINSLKKKAEEAYLNGDYQSAFQSYQLLVDTLMVEDDNLLMNYANSAYFLTGLTGKISDSNDASQGNEYAEAAMSGYQRLTGSGNQLVQSAAYNQIGVINYHLGKNVQQGDKYLNESLAYFKQSLKSDWKNDDARYNYELLKKQLENQQDQEQEQNEDQEQNQDQQNQEQENQDQQQNQEQQEQQSEDQQNQGQQQQDEQQNQEESEQNQSQQQEGEEEKKEGQENQPQESEEQSGEQEEQEVSPPSEKFKEMNISEEMAKMILEAMRNNEVQYIQQQKRKPTKRADSSKPDW